MNCTSCQSPLQAESRFCSVCGHDQETRDGEQPTSGSGTVLLARLSEVLKGRYRVTKMAGRGGMAAVFLAEDLQLERPVAIKVLPPEVAHDERLVGRFEREARTAAKLDHPNIIPIYAVEHSTDLYYFVMKYVAGDSLDQVLKRGSLPLERTLDILWESARALGHAHQRGVIHRDVKPANIMMDHDGRVVLTDFGISKAMQAATQLTGTGQVIGTPHYMSPEQAKGGDVDGRSDQYSLGVVGYQMVTGRLPFGDDSIHAVIYKHVSELPPRILELNPSCPPFLATAIHRALQKKQEDRFATMEAFAQAVCPDRRLSVGTSPSSTRTRSGASVAAAPTEISKPSLITSRQRGRARRRAAFGALLVLGLIGGSYWPWRAGLFEQVGLPGPASAEPETGSAASGGPQGEPLTPTLAALPDSSTPPPRFDSARTVASGGESDDSALAVEPDVQQPQRSPVSTNASATTRTQPPVPARRTGTVTVNTDPWGRLFIDDSLIGDTPQVEIEVEAGLHIIKVISDRCQQFVDTVMVYAGDQTTIIKQLVCQ